MTTNTSELEKLEPGFLKGVVSRTLIGIAVALPIVSTAGSVVEHVRSSHVDEQVLRRVDHLAPQAVFDITKMSENAPADLQALKQAIAEKRSAMNEAVQDVGVLGRLLGWEKGIQGRYDAYEAHIKTVQAKIDEIVKDGWQPTEYMKNRSDDQRKLDDIFVQGARSMYGNFVNVQTVQVRSR